MILILRHLLPQHVSHAERWLCHSYWCSLSECVCVCEMTSNDVSSKKAYTVTIWMVCHTKILYSMFIWKARLCTWVCFFLNLRTHIYNVYVYVPVGNRHVYTVQLSWSLFLRHKFKANAFLILWANLHWLAGFHLKLNASESLNTKPITRFHLYVTCHMEDKSQKEKPCECILL